MTEITCDRRSCENNRNNKCVAKAISFENKYCQMYSRFNAGNLMKPYYSPDKTQSRKGTQEK